jgi:hypothetical protein
MTIAGLRHTEFLVLSANGNDASDPSNDVIFKAIYLSNTGASPENSHPGYRKVDFGDSNGHVTAVSLT